jgi:hypothetical protein
MALPFTPIKFNFVEGHGHELFAMLDALLIFGVLGND